MKERNRSVLFVFLASVCFSTGGLFIKLIPWNALAINGARNLIGALVIGSYLSRIRGSTSGSTWRDFLRCFFRRA